MKFREGVGIEQAKTDKILVAVRSLFVDSR